MGFVTGYERETSGRSKNISRIAFIEKSSFFEVLRKFPRDYVFIIILLLLL